MAKKAKSSYESLTFPLDMLPDGLQNKILFHLPTDDAIRYKTVCKKWKLGTEAWASSTPMAFTPQPQKPFYFMFNTMVAGIGTYAYNSDKQRWVSFKIPNSEQRSALDLPHLSQTPFNISASGGLVCLMDVRKQENIFICNPVLKGQIKLLPKAPCTFYRNKKVPDPLADYWSITLSTDIRSRKYEIALIRYSRVDDVQIAHNMTIHLYKSDTHAWVNLHSEKLVNWEGDSSCVICKDVLYSVVRFDCEWSTVTQPTHAIVAYNLSQGKQKQSLAKTMVHVPCPLACARLLNSNDKLIMVGGVENWVTMKIESIIIWEMCGNGWREITHAPNDLIRHFCKGLDDYFLCSGYGNFIFIQGYASTAVLSYEFSNNIWTFLTDPPFPLERVRDYYMRFKGFCFEPRLDIVP